MSGTLHDAAILFDCGDGTEDDDYCPTCDNKGYIITCCDDLCANSDHCIHGDGESMCPTCKGASY